MSETNKIFSNSINKPIHHNEPRVEEQSVPIPINQLNNNNLVINQPTPANSPINESFVTYYVITEVDYVAVDSNKLNKDDYKAVSKILFVSTNKNEASLKHKDFLSGYPEDKYKVIVHGSNIFDVIDTEKKYTWLSGYRENRPIKSIVLDVWRSY